MKESMREARKLLYHRLVTFGLALLCMAAAALADYGVQAVTAMWADVPAGVELPIIMYHSILKDPQRAGSFVVSPSMLQADLRYLKEHGYTTVVVSELVNYVNGVGELPDQPVMITFDDGYYNNLVYVEPILQKLKMKAVVSVVGEYTALYSDKPDANPNYAYLTWEDIMALRESGVIEIQNHSYALHLDQNGRKGSMRKAGEEEAAYEALFRSDAERLQALLWEKCGFRPTAYTYPYGAISVESRTYLQDMGFQASFSCNEKINLITKNPACLFELGRYNRPSGITTPAFMERILPD